MMTQVRLISCIAFSISFGDVRFTKSTGRIARKGILNELAMSVLISFLRTDSSDLSILSYVFMNRFEDAFRMHYNFVEFVSQKFLKLCEFSFRQKFLIEKHFAY